MPKLSTETDLDWAIRQLQKVQRDQKKKARQAKLKKSERVKSKHEIADKLQRKLADRLLAGKEDLSKPCKTVGMADAKKSIEFSFRVHFTK